MFRKSGALRAVPSSVLFLALSLTACGDDGSDDESPQDGDDTEQTEETPIKHTDDDPVEGDDEDDGSEGDDESEDDDSQDEAEVDAGTAPTSRVCRGVADSCLSAIGPLTCGNIMGCSWTEGCTGIADSCYSQFSSFSCNDLDGCYWSSSTDSCSGSSWSCSLYSESFGCTSQGCNWDGNCDGLPYPCESLGESECYYQPGCELVEE